MSKCSEGNGLERDIECFIATMAQRTSYIALIRSIHKYYWKVEAPDTSWRKMTINCHPIDEQSIKEAVTGAKKAPLKETDA
jgi:hypothetical protein